MFFRDVWLCRLPVSDEVVQKCPDGERSGFFSRRANRLVIFSDIDGLYDSDPRLHPEARLLSRIECIDDGAYAMAGGAGSRRGRSGMKTKLQAVRLATAQGIDTIITNGACPEALWWRAGRRGRCLPEGSESRTGYRKRRCVRSHGQCGCGCRAGRKKALCERNSHEWIGTSANTHKQIR